jgi:tetratricopeptide (TPR) repeat protein
MWLLMSMLVLPSVNQRESIAYAQGSGSKKKKPKSGKANRKPTRARSPGVRVLFDRAQKLYGEGKYEQAINEYASILRTYTGHTPSLIQLAKSLYRLDRYLESYQVFTRINPQNLDPETSYEYGWSFYTARQWEGALYAFKRVPAGHALSDLSNYYGGICAMKLKRYDEAEDMLEKAVVLPDKLSKSRALYLKHVGVLRIMQEKSSLRKERLIEKQRQRQEQKRIKREQTAPPPAAQAKLPDSFQHEGNLGVKRQATVSHENLLQDKDQHGFSRTVFDTKVTTFDLFTGPRGFLPIKFAGGRKAAWGLQLFLGMEDRIQKGKEERIVIFEEDPQRLSRILRTQDPETETLAGAVSANLWGEFPIPALPGKWWLGLGGELYFNYPEFKRGLRFGNRSVYSQISGTHRSSEFLVSARYVETLNEENDPTSIATIGYGKASREFITDVTGALELFVASFDYLLGEIDGPDSTAAGKLSISQGLPFEFSLSGNLGYEVQSNFVRFKMPRWSVIIADAEVLTAEASLDWQAFPWLAVNVKAGTSLTKWKADNSEMQETLELNVVNIANTYSGKVSVDLAF